MKKSLIITITAIIVIVSLSIFVGTGFSKNTNVVISNYSISNDGKELTFDTNIISSMGYIRGFKNNGGKSKPHYLEFYSTFGGPNSLFLARNEFKLELSEDDTEIYFNREDGEYELVLKKAIETGQWVKP